MGANLSFVFPEKRELLKARELLRSVDDLEALGAGLDDHNQMPVSSSTVYTFASYLPYDTLL